MRFLKQCLQALPSPPLSLPDPARRPPTFSIVHTDREPGTGQRQTDLLDFFFHSRNTELKQECTTCRRSLFLFAAQYYIKCSQLLK